MKRDTSGLNLPGWIRFDRGGRWREIDLLPAHVDVATGGITLLVRVGLVKDVVVRRTIIRYAYGPDKEVEVRLRMSNGGILEWDALIRATRYEEAYVQLCTVGPCVVVRKGR